MATVKAFIKKHSKNEFYVKPVRGGYFMVINGYDMSMESLEDSREDAEKLCKKLNEMGNKMYNLN